MGEQEVESIQSNSLEKAIQTIRSVNDSYTHEANVFADFLEHRGELSPTILQEYVSYIHRFSSPKTENPIAAETYNKYMKAVKHRIRMLIRSDAFTPLMRYQVEEHLKSLKYKRIHSHAVNEESIPTKREMQFLIEKAPRKLSLILQFLLRSGVRISEALSVEYGDVKENKRSVKVRIRDAKGRKERVVYVKRDLYDAIVKEFQGKRYLFEHHGKQYSRNSIANRVRELSAIYIGKAISPHDVRHRLGTDMTKKLGLWAAKEYLGHSSISVTDEFYNHNRVTADDIERLYAKDEDLD